MARTILLMLAAAATLLLPACASDGYYGGADGGFSYAGPRADTSGAAASRAPEASAAPRTKAERVTAVSRSVLTFAAGA